MKDMAVSPGSTAANPNAASSSTRRQYPGDDDDGIIRRDRYREGDGWAEDEDNDEEGGMWGDDSDEEIDRSELTRRPTRSGVTLRGTRRNEFADLRLFPPFPSPFAHFPLRSALSLRRRGWTWRAKHGRWGRRSARVFNELAASRLNGHDASFIFCCCSLLSSSQQAHETSHARKGLIGNPIKGRLLAEQG